MIDGGRAMRLPFAAYSAIRFPQLFIFSLFLVFSCQVNNIRGKQDRVSIGDGGKTTLGFVRRKPMLW